MRSRWPALVLGLVVSGAAPGGLRGQSVEWIMSPAVFVDPDFSGEGRLGPAASAAVYLRPRGTISYGLVLATARTDFPVGVDDLHRYFFSAAATVRVMTTGERLAVGVALGVGIAVEDDLSETDPSFRSSANGQSVFTPEVLVRLPVSASWGITAFARDHVGGWFDTIFDPSEGALNHRYLIGLGVHIRR